MTASRTLFVEVWGYDHPCSECQHSMTWVFGLRPWYRPAVGELVTCDKPMAVNVARELLERDGSGDLAAQLKPVLSWHAVRASIRTPAQRVETRPTGTRWTA